MKTAFRSTALAVILLALTGLTDANAACTSPAGIEGSITWNGSNAVIWCDGANWNSLASGGGGITALTGNITASGTGSVVATIANGAVTYAKMQNTSAASVLLGRGAGAGAGNVQELTLGSGLSLSGTTLSATGGGTVSGTTNYVAKFTGASAVGNSQIFDNGTNVGIGTTAPAKLLTVSSTGSLGGPTFGGGVPVLRLQNSGSWSEPSLEFMEIGSNPIASIAAKNTGGGAGDLIFLTRLAAHTTPSERMRIDTNGNVGIGTATPADAVHALRDQNAATRLQVSNSDLGASASAQLTVANVGGSVEDTLRMMAMGRGFGSIGGFVQDGGAVVAGSNLTGGLSLIAREAAAPIRLYAGGESNEVMRITATGNVGIGITTFGAKLYVQNTGTNQDTIVATTDVPSRAALSAASSVSTAYAGYFYVSGGSTCYIGNGSVGWACSSDIRKKKNVLTLVGALDKVEQLRGVSFRWKNSSDDGDKLGVIAQEVQKVFPQAVNVDNDGFLSVDYDALIGPMIEAVKELKAANDKLRSELETANDNQAAEIEALRAEIEALKKAGH